jgi:hypothetical protein
MRRFLAHIWPIAAFLLAACGQEPAPGEVAKKELRLESQPGEAKAAPVVEASLSPKPATECREVLDLLHVQRFTLEELHTYRWMKDHPAITKGTLVVLEVEPECARPRQVAMPVLYAGHVPVEIARDGFPSGRLVAIVPGHVDLTETLIFYGAPDLAERVDRTRGEEELASALAEGITPFSSKVVTGASGGGVLRLVDTTDLYGAVAEID